MVKKRNANRKYYFILLLITVIAIGFVVYLSKQFIVNTQTGDLTGLTVSEKEAKVVFDVYEMTTEDNGDQWQDAIVIPRVVDSNNLQAEDLFFEYAIQKITGEDWSKYVLIKKGAQPEEANNNIRLLITINSDGSSGLNNDSQTTINEYIFKNMIFSGLFNRYTTGGAHPTNSSITINYDLLKGKEIKLEDILSTNNEQLIDYLETLKNSGLSDYSEYQNCSRLELTPNGYYLTKDRLVIMTSPSWFNSDCPLFIAVEYATIEGITKKDSLLKRIVD